jgi:catechol 2,3-dioxygenase-like lactoylglutathione lyase family enzyme
MQGRVTGIGGIFFKSADPAALAEWYRVHLGMPVEVWGGAVFRWVTPENPGGTGSTVWSPFPADSSSFAAPFMINLRVDDLTALLARLRAAGCAVDDQVESSDQGEFGWVTDPEGHRVELWQPPAGR